MEERLTTGSAVTGRRRHQPIRNRLDKLLKTLKSLAGQHSTVRRKTDYRYAEVVRNLQIRASIEALVTVDSSEGSELWTLRLLPGQFAYRFLFILPTRLPEQNIIRCVI